MTSEASRQRWPEPEIDFSTFPGRDGEPMADTERNQREMINTMFSLRHPLEPIGHHVGGNLIIYYNPANGLDHLSPDVFVALDRDAGLRESWKTWLEGKFPEVVVEIASPSTEGRDIGEKLRRYGALGAREYYVHDPARRLQPAFRGYRAAGGALLPVPNPSGGRIRSEVLGLELRVGAGWLRVIDPASGEPYPTSDEVLGLQRHGERAQHRVEERGVQEETAHDGAEQGQRQTEGIARHGAEDGGTTVRRRAHLPGRAAGRSHGSGAAGPARRCGADRRLDRTIPSAAGRQVSPVAVGTTLHRSRQHRRHRPACAACRGLPQSTHPADPVWANCS